MLWSLRLLLVRRYEGPHFYSCFLCVPAQLTGRMQGSIRHG